MKELEWKGHAVLHVCQSKTIPAEYNMLVTLKNIVSILTASGVQECISAYHKTSSSGPSKERTPPLEQTDQLPPIELTILHLNPPKRHRADTHGVTNIRTVQVYLRRQTSSAAPTLI